jgi:hypothetical protein
MSNQKLKLDTFLKKGAEGLLSDVRTEIAEQSLRSPAGKLVGRGHFTHRIPAPESKPQTRPQHIRKERAERGKHCTRKAEMRHTVYCQKCDRIVSRFFIQRQTTESSAAKQ